MFVLSSLPVDPLLAGLARDGAVSLPLIDDGCRRILLEAAEGATFRPARESIGQGPRIVYQRMEVCDAFPGDSIFRQFRDGFQALWDRSFSQLRPYPFESQVVFNDLMLQRYTAGEIGITPHRDRTSYRNIICLFIIAGHGRFLVCEDREGNSAIEISNAPGDLVLTRAPGCQGTDKRPFHFVRDITSARYVFGLRHEVR